MLSYIKQTIKSFLNNFSYGIFNTKIASLSDDPFHVLSILLKKYQVTTIIDGGASIGDTSSKLRQIFPHSKVIAVEPFPKFFEFIQQKSLVDNDIVPLACALGETCKQEYLYVNQSEGTNSLYKSTDSGVKIYGKLLKTENQIRIEQTTISQIHKNFSLDSIDILKLDLQGGELNALRGAKELLSTSKIKTIICEVMFQNIYDQKSTWLDIFAFLQEYNFDLFNFYQFNFHNGKALQADCIFIQNDFYESLNINNNSFQLNSKLILP